MGNKQLFLSGAMLLTAAMAAAAPVEHKIPASSEEFAAQWIVVPGEADGTWEYVADAATPYARTTAVTDGEKGASLLYGTPVSLKAGDVVYVQAFVSSEHYNDDEWFYIVYGTDTQSLTDMPDDSNSFKCWGKSGGGVNFSYKPADTSKMRELTIPADGDYYFGVRSKKGTKSYNTLAVAGLKFEKSVNYPKNVTSSKAVADPNGAMEVTLTWKWPTQNKDNSTISGTVGANIYRATSNSKADLYVPENLIATVTGGAAGETATFVDNAANSSQAITEPGKYYYYIAAFNDQGENSAFDSAARTECKWVGEDIKPLNPLNPVAKAVGDNVELSFTKRVEGYNGGWVDTEKFFIAIERSKNGGEFTVIESEYKGESPYVDSTLDGPGSYAYKIYAVYNGAKSSETKSSAIFAGGSFELPYAESFDTKGALDMYTILSSHSSYKWAYSTSDQAAMFSGGYSSYTSTLATPALKLEAGVPYVVSCDAWVNELADEGDDGGDDPWGDWYSADAAVQSTDATHNNVLHVMLGTGATDADLKEIDAVEINVLKADMLNCKVYFSVETSGTYYIGFKATTEGYSDKKYIDNVKVERSVTIPAAVADLKAETDKGENHALISFTAPSATNTGAEITGALKAVVTRYDAEDVPTVVKTLEECAPGAAVTFTDELPEAGFYHYSVVTYLDDNASDAAATAAVWYGYDTPKAISSFGMSVDTEGEAPVVTWNALSATNNTVNGGYLDMAGIKYNVYRRYYSALSNVEESYVLAGVAEGTSFTDTDAASITWGKYYYSISVVNGDKEGNRTERSNSVVLGDAVALPYTHDFSAERNFDIFEGRGWFSYADKTNGGYTYGAVERGATEGQEYTFYLPPFRCDNTARLGIVLTTSFSRTTAATEENVEVYLCTIEADTPELKDDITSEPEAAVILGQDKRQLIKTLPVTGTAMQPQEDTVSFDVPATGRYRLAIRLASPESAGVHLHALNVVNSNTIAAIDAIDADAAGNDTDAVYYNLQGVRVDNPAAGIYIRVSGNITKKVIVK